MTPVEPITSDEAQRNGSSTTTFYDRLDLVKPSYPSRTRVQIELLRGRASAAAAPIRVLDIGCGEGFQAAMAGQMATVVGMDIGSLALARARDRGVMVVQAGVDGCDLPFRDGAFDVVMFSEVIEHLVDTDHVVDEISRVLVDGGTLLISTPNLAAWFNRGLLLLGIQPLFSEVSLLAVYGRPGSQVAGHLRLFTARALRELLEAHGLVDVKLHGAAFHALPGAVRWLDRLMMRWPSMSAVLVAQATKGPCARSGRR